MTEEQVKLGSEIIGMISELEKRVGVFSALSNGEFGAEIQTFEFKVSAMFDVESGGKSTAHGSVSSGMSMSNNLQKILSEISPELMDESMEFARRVSKIFNKKIKSLKKELEKI